MESEPKTPDNFTDYEQFAVEIFDGVDELFAQRNIPSIYEKISDRHSVVELTVEELEQVGPLLESYAIDAPNSVNITINGHNPFYKGALLNTADALVVCEYLVTNFDVNDGFDCLGVVAIDPNCVLAFDIIAESVPVVRGDYE